MRDRVNRYFFTSFVDNFISLFVTLFLIVSIAFFINLSRITSYIEISFGELFKLYSFLLPQILLFTLPICFFVSLTISLFKLSKDNESIVIFTLGKSPKDIASFFTLIAFGLSILLLLNALILLPYMQHLNAKFIDYKRTNLSLNIKAGELGQNIAGWHIYAAQKDENSLDYKDIVLFKPSDESQNERFIISSSGQTQNSDGAVSMVLGAGNFYDISEGEWRIGNFDKMIFTTPLNSSLHGDFDPFEYWQKDKNIKNFSIFTLCALFPLASVLFTFCFGLVVARYERGSVYAGIFCVLFVYFALIMLFATRPAVAIPLTFILTFGASIFAFKHKVLSKF